MGEAKGVWKVLVGKREENEQLGRPERRWEDDFKMNVSENKNGAWLD
jgi:hypothetical protein